MQDHRFWSQVDGAPDLTQVFIKRNHLFLFNIFYFNHSFIFYFSSLKAGSLELPKKYINFGFGSTAQKVEMEYGPLGLKCSGSQFLSEWLRGFELRQLSWIVAAPHSSKPSANTKSARAVVRFAFAALIKHHGLIDGVHSCIINHS